MEPIIGYPNSITFIRHGESPYNALRALKDADPLYQEFKRSYEESMGSPRTRDLAQKVQEKFKAEWGDHSTPLTDEGKRQAKMTGQKLGCMMPHPDIIFASPYRRTRDTLTHLMNGWPQDGVVVTPANLIPKGVPGHRETKNHGDIQNVEVIFENLLREQSYGIGILYNDWRVFQTFMPEQKMLRELNGPFWYQYPQGESIAHVQERIEHFHNNFLMKCAGKDVLIVSHHRTILSYVASQEGLSPEEVLELDGKDPPVNCGVTIYKNTGEKLELEYYNKCLWK